MTWKHSLTQERDSGAKVTPPCGGGLLAIPSLARNADVGTRSRWKQGCRPVFGSAAPEISFAAKFLQQGPDRGTGSRRPTGTGKEPTIRWSLTRIGNLGRSAIENRRAFDRDVPGRIKLHHPARHPHAFRRAVSHGDNRRRAHDRQPAT